MNNEWINMFFNKQFNTHKPIVKFRNTSNFRIGNNLLAKQIYNTKWQNKALMVKKSYQSFKIECKDKFLSQVNL